MSFNDVEDNSKVAKKCGCKTGCKALCGCKKSGVGCNETCFCKSNCQNSFNGLKRSLSFDAVDSIQEEESEDDKENETENLHQTPKKIK